MDALVLPGLALTIVVFLVYVWRNWVIPKGERALTSTEDDGVESPTEPD